MCLDHLYLVARYHARAQTMMSVQNGIIEHYLKPFLAECIHILAHHIAAQGGVHHVIVGGLGIPYAESAVVLGGKAAIGHMGRLGCLGPLLAIQMLGIENRCWQVRVGPVFGSIGGDVVMDKHTEAQVNKFLLQLMQRLCGSKCHQTGDQQACQRDNGSFHKLISFYR